MQTSPLRRRLIYGVLIASAVAGLTQVGEIHRAWCSHWSDVADPMRAQWPITKQTLVALDLQQGQTVADIGAGSGFYAVRIANSVGANGMVTATEANIYSLLSLYWNRYLHNASALQPVLQSYEDLVPAGSFDRMLMFNVFPFRRCSPELTRTHLRQLAHALRPEGKLVIVHDVLRQPGTDIKDVGCGDPSLDELKAVLPYDLEVLSYKHMPDPQTPGLTAGYLLELGRASVHAAR